MRHSRLTTGIVQYKGGRMMKKDHPLVITIRVLAYLAVLILLMITWRVMTDLGPYGGGDVLATIIVGIILLLIIIVWSS